MNRSVLSLAALGVGLMGASAQAATQAYWDFNSAVNTSGVTQTLSNGDSLMATNGVAGDPRAYVPDLSGNGNKLQTWATNSYFSSDTPKGAAGDFSYKDAPLRMRPSSCSSAPER